MPDFASRRARAYQVYYEHMPLRAAQLPVGPTCSSIAGCSSARLSGVNVLDTRQYRSASGTGELPADRAGRRLLSECARSDADDRGRGTAGVVDRGTASGRRRTGTCSPTRCRSRPTTPTPIRAIRTFGGEKWDGYPPRSPADPGCPQRNADWATRSSSPATSTRISCGTCRRITCGLTPSPSRPSSSARRSAPAATARCRRCSADNANNPHLQFSDNHHGYVRCTVTPISGARTTVSCRLSSSRSTAASARSPRLSWRGDERAQSWRERTERAKGRSSLSGCRESRQLYDRVLRFVGAQPGLAGPTAIDSAAGADRSGPIESLAMRLGRRLSQWAGVVRRDPRLRKTPGVCRPQVRCSVYSFDDGIVSAGQGRRTGPASYRSGGCLTLNALSGQPLTSLLRLERERYRARRRDRTRAGPSAGGGRGSTRTCCRRSRKQQELPCCPACGTLAWSYHSLYDRRLRDLPWQGRREQSVHMDAAFLRFCPTARDLRRPALRFRAMLRGRKATRLAVWMHDGLFRVSFPGAVCPGAATRPGRSEAGHYQSVE